jgi:hypothetical protein
MAAQPQVSDATRSVLPFKLRTLVTVAILLALGVAGRKLYDSLQAELLQSPRYKITADVLHIEPEALPPWIRTEVKAQVLRESGLTESLTLLDPPNDIQQRLVDAFELHPWVKAVDSVELAGPTRINLRLTYREPIAVVDIVGSTPPTLLPVDADAVRLPDDDLTDVEKSYLPRITGIEDRPLEGEAWSDMRMQGAVALAARLREVWEPYSLLDIVPSDYPDVQRSHRFYTYEIRTSGGTAIQWGAAPNQTPPGESSFEEKLARLAGYVQQYGPLDSIDSPQSIDVRDALHVERRTVQRSDPEEKVR